MWPLTAASTRTHPPCLWCEFDRPRVDSCNLCLIHVERALSSRKAAVNDGGGTPPLSLIVRPHILLTAHLLFVWQFARGGEVFITNREREGGTGGREGKGDWTGGVGRRMRGGGWNWSDVGIRLGGSEIGSGSGERETPKRRQ